MNLLSLISSWLSIIYQITTKYVIIPNLKLFHQTKHTLTSAMIIEVSIAAKCLVCYQILSPHSCVLLSKLYMGLAPYARASAQLIHSGPGLVGRVERRGPSVSRLASPARLTLRIRSSPSVVFPLGRTSAALVGLKTVGINRDKPVTIFIFTFEYENK